MRKAGKLTFLDEDMKRYGRLDIAARDLYQTIEFGEFILKMGWKAKPWSRGTTYLQQSAFVTSMVVSYGRAFSKSNGWGKLPKFFIQSFTSEEASLHADMLDKRNQVYAHSDSVHYPISPWDSDHHTDIITLVVFEVPPEEIAMLKEMCLKVIQNCREEKVKIRAKYL